MIPVITIFKNGYAGVVYNINNHNDKSIRDIGVKYVKDAIHGHCLYFDDTGIPFEDCLVWSYNGHVIFEYER